MASAVLQPAAGGGGGDLLRNCPAELGGETELALCKGVSRTP